MRFFSFVLIKLCESNGMDTNFANNDVDLYLNFSQVACFIDRWFRMTLSTAARYGSIRSGRDVKCLFDCFLSAHS